MTADHFPAQYPGSPAGQFLIGLRRALADGTFGQPLPSAGSEPNDGPGPDGHHVETGECFACMVGVATGPESHGDRCPHAR